MTLQAWRTCIWGVSYLQILSSCVRLDREQRCTAIFRYLQKCLIGFKSGLWLGHSRTFRDLSQSHSCVVLAVCLGSLFYWKVHLHPECSVTGFHQGSLCTVHLSLDLDLSASPAAEKHPHSMMLPLPCFTVGMVPGFFLPELSWHLGQSVLSRFHQTRAA